MYLSKTYAIYDWTGRELTDLGEFKTFEDGWCFISQNFAENDHGEYSVQRK